MPCLNYSSVVRLGFLPSFQLCGQVRVQCNVHPFIPVACAQSSVNRHPRTTPCTPLLGCAPLLGSVLAAIALIASFVESFLDRSLRRSLHRSSGCRIRVRRYLHHSSALPQLGRRRGDGCFPSCCRLLFVVSLIKLCPSFLPVSVYLI